MFRLPKDFGRKVAKGFNIKAHFEEVLELREYIQAPWLLLVVGTMLAVVLRVLGVWGMLNGLIAGMIPMLNGLVNSQIIFLSVLSYFYLPLLAQNIFMSRAKSNKSHESYITYMWRYVKGMVALILGPSALAFTLVVFVIYIILPILISLQEGPRTLLTLLMMGLLYLLVFVVLGGVSFVSIVYGIGLCTYSFAFLLQGHSLHESVSRGMRLFSAQRAYTLSLIALFFVTPMLVHFGILAIIANYFPNVSGNEFLKEFLGYVYMVWYLIYYTLFFAYHKRVSKIPSSR